MKDGPPHSWGVKRYELYDRDTCNGIKGAVFGVDMYAARLGSRRRRLRPRLESSAATTAQSEPGAMPAEPEGRD